MMLSKRIVMSMDIGSRIKQARVEKGISRSNLAELLGLTASAISNYENGISRPRHDTLCEIIKLLDTDANFIYQDDAPGIGDNTALSEVSDYEQKYRALDERGRETVDKILDLEYSRAMSALKND